MEWLFYPVAAYSAAIVVIAMIAVLGLQSKLSVSDVVDVNKFTKKHSAANHLLAHTLLG